jgi:hypothetical protein
VTEPVKKRERIRRIRTYEVPKARYDTLHRLRMELHGLCKREPPPFEEIRETRLAVVNLHYELNYAPGRINERYERMPGSLYDATPGFVRLPHPVPEDY